MREYVMGTLLITVIFEGSGEKIEEEKVAHGLTRIFTEAVDSLRLCLWKSTANMFMEEEEERGSR